MVDPTQIRPNSPTIGARIRERRLAKEMRQGALAQAAGISASYLNLIEHNKRRIGGKLLVDLARALGVEPGALSAGPEASVFEALQETASRQAQSAVPPEIDRIESLLSRYPGWADALAAQHREIVALEGLNDALRDRLRHDQVLADAMHDLISTAAAIRSTAAILVDDPELDPQWRARFNRNLHEEAERLAERATALSRHLEAEGHQTRPIATPGETVEMLFDRANHHFPQIEAEGAGAIPDLLTGLPEMDMPSTRATAQARLELYAQDAAALPLEPFLEAATAAGFEADALYGLAGGDVARVLRRLASLPQQSSAPDVGLAVCDASGALLYRRRHASFAVPRFASGCPLWPLYRALGRPLMPERTRITLPDGTALQSWSVSQPVAYGPGGDPMMQATMLVRAAPQDGAPGLPVGPGCRLCTRSDCAARQGPNLTG